MPDKKVHCITVITVRSLKILGGTTGILTNLHPSQKKNTAKVTKPPMRQPSTCDEVHANEVPPQLRARTIIEQPPRVRRQPT